MVSRLRLWCGMAAQQPLRPFWLRFVLVSERVVVFSHFWPQRLHPFGRSDYGSLPADTDFDSILKRANPIEA
jgi:hypothetical protein